jgi:hypothetical protein
LPVVLVVSAIFVRTRRLRPLIVAHWTADALAVLPNLCTDFEVRGGL